MSHDERTRICLAFALDSFYSWQIAFANISNEDYQFVQPEELSTPGEKDLLRLNFVS